MAGWGPCCARPAGSCKSWSPETFRRGRVSIDWTGTTRVAQLYNYYMHNIITVVYFWCIHKQNKSIWCKMNEFTPRVCVLTSSLSQLRPLRVCRSLRVSLRPNPSLNTSWELPPLSTLYTSASISFRERDSIHVKKHTQTGNINLTLKLIIYESYSLAGSRIK